jgi:hypothetical protein
MDLQNRFARLVNLARPIVPALARGGRPRQARHLITAAASVALLVACQTPSATYSLRIDEAAVLSNDRTLVADAFFGCGNAPHLVATPHAGTVVLAIAEPPQCPEQQVRPVETTLAAPLRGRALVQAGTMAPIPTVFQARLASVSVLPRGYRFDGLVPSYDSGDPAPGWQKGELAATQIFTPGDGNGATVTVCQATATGPPGCAKAAWPVIATLDVQGHKAVYQAETDAGTAVGAESSIKWSAGGRVFVVLSWVAHNGQHLCSQAQMLAIARGVRLAGWPG